MVPYFDSSSDQPSTTPGTVTESTPVFGMRVRLRDAKTSGDAAYADRPLAFSARSVFVFASYTIANRSPPMPVIDGSTTASTAAAVTAASMALPPSCMTFRPATDASG